MADEAQQAAPESQSGSSTRTALEGKGGQQDASVGFVTQTYTNYVEDIQKAFEGLRQRAVALQQEAPAQLQQLQSQIQPQTQELVQTIQETQAPISLPTSSVIEIFGWSSILLLSAGVSSIVGGYILSPILGIFLGRLGAGLIASLILPAAVAYSMREANGATAESRFQLLLLSAAQGLLMGHAIAYRYISSQPLGFITPLTIAFAYPLIAGQVGTAHAPLLGGTLAASFAAQFAVGLVSGLSLSYLTLAALYTATSGVVLQVVFKHLQSPSKIHLYQALLVSGFLFSKALVYGLFGSSEPPKH